MQAVLRGGDDAGLVCAGELVDELLAGVDEADVFLRFAQPFGELLRRRGRIAAADRVAQELAEHEHAGVELGGVLQRVHRDRASS